MEQKTQSDLQLQEFLVGKVKAYENAAPWEEKTVDIKLKIIGSIKVLAAVINNTEHLIIRDKDGNAYFSFYSKTFNCALPKVLEHILDCE